MLLTLAIAIDLALGEPARFIHPVVWMGKVMSLLEKGNKGKSPIIQFIYGSGIVLFNIGLFAVPVYLILLYLKNLNFIAYIVAAAVLLKPTFSLKELRRAALKVKRCIVEDKLDEARVDLRSLVSRDTAKLPKPLLISAVVESVAENAGDSFVAPLFYFLLLGVPGAIAYRVVNTMDAMIGYHGKYEFLGKFASRLDDILNFVPARLTALLLVLAAFLLRKDGRNALQVAFKEHSRTESPNAGWPIAAVAGALNVQLGKVGQYTLGTMTTALISETIAVALNLMLVAMIIWVLICLLAGGTQVVLRA